MSSVASPETTATRLLMLQLGAERIPKSLSVAGASASLLWEPVQAMLVETAAGWVLLETGIGRDVAADPATQAGYAGAAAAAGLSADDGPEGPLWPAGAPDSWCWGRDLETVLAEHGVALDQLALAAVSHLHVDHTGGLPALARAGVPVAVQRAELDFARTPAAREGGYHAADVEGHDIAWRVLDGDATLAPGVHAITTPGHTPGHMSYRVELPDTGCWLFAVDAADLAQNVLDGAAPGSCGASEAEGRASIARLVTEANRRRARLVPGHDQLALHLVAHPPGGHR